MGQYSIINSGQFDAAFLYCPRNPAKMQVMPDTRRHRGPHPDDAALFNKQTVPALRRAVADMSWLLSGGYAEKSGLKLVGDRYNLTGRQRLAVMRCACSDQQRDQRRIRQVGPGEVTGQRLVLDGYNVLITIEAALSGGVLFIARDGCIRDLASIHGTYHKVEETIPAIEVIAQVLKKLASSEVLWLLDKPVSNSGRLKRLILEFAAEKSLNWNVELDNNPDKRLAETPDIIATSDSAVLDQGVKWHNLVKPCLNAISNTRDVKQCDLSIHPMTDML